MPCLDPFSIPPFSWDGNRHPLAKLEFPAQPYRLAYRRDLEVFTAAGLNLRGVGDDATSQALSVS
jgi:hypothetical protein